MATTESARRLLMLVQVVLDRSLMLLSTVRELLFAKKGGARAIHFIIKILILEFFTYRCHCILLIHFQYWSLVLWLIKLIWFLLQLLVQYWFLNSLNPFAICTDCFFRILTVLFELITSVVNSNLHFTEKVMILWSFLAPFFLGLFNRRLLPNCWRLKLNLFSW